MRSALPAALAAALLVLAGCGGGDGPQPAEAANGLWSGSTGSNRTVTGLVYEDGFYYVMYSSPGFPAVLGGAVMGRSSLDGSAFSSSNALHLNLEGLGVLRASVDGAVEEKSSFDGTILSTGIPPVTFNTGYDRDFQRTATPDALAGAYAGTLGTSSGKQAATWTIGASGGFTLTAANGCTLSGLALPRPGTNSYNVALVFGAEPCPLPGQQVAGVAYLRAGEQRLYLAAPNTGWTDAALLSGLKQ